MRLADADILIIPGLGNSGPDHWQSRWQAKIATARRVEQADWDAPEPEDWAARIAAAVNAATRPVVLVAHSCGVAGILRAAPKFDAARVGGAFLVACTDVEEAAFEPRIRRFAPLPTARLAFPSLLVASRDDPYVSFDRAEGFANALGAELADAGEAGHIDAASGHGPWPEGLMRFAGFLRRL
jgi:uncharacterized protein